MKTLEKARNILNEHYIDVVLATHDDILAAVELAGGSPSEQAAAAKILTTRKEIVFGNRKGQKRRKLRQF